jgi:hypothetical protein
MTQSYIIAEIDSDSYNHLSIRKQIVGTALLVRSYDVHRTQLPRMTHFLFQHTLSLGFRCEKLRLA